MQITIDLLRNISRGRDDIMRLLPPAMTKYMPVFKIDTLFRAAHFLAQAAHESDGFRVMEEYASGKAYENRTDLGNVEPGDGPRYKGRGIFQLTGRDNYDRMGQRLSIDLIGSPELASDPDTAVHIACLYWSDHSLNALADADDIKAITKAINGGYNGLASRVTYLRRAKLGLQALD